MASDSDEVLSAGSERAVESLAGLTPAKDAEKETGGRGCGGSAPPRPPPGVPCGLGVVEERSRWFPESAL